MKFHRINVVKFGILKDLEITDVGPGLNAIYGSNGSGKSTWFRFVRGLLCGYSEARRRALLSPADGEACGGTIEAQFEERRLRLTRSPVSDQLSVDSSKTSHESIPTTFDSGLVRSDLIEAVYTASGAEGRALDALVERAIADGIPMVTHREDSTRLRQTASEIHRERTQLIQTDGIGRMEELTKQRQRLEGELDQTHRPTPPPLWAVGFAARQDGGRAGGRERTEVTRLQQQLAAAQCDLREAEDRAWSSHPARFRVERPLSNLPIVVPRSTQSRPEHLRVRRIPELQRLDRQIAQARILLAEAAQARLEINLRAAQVAGSNVSSTGLFLGKVRELIFSMEDCVLELRERTPRISNTSASQAIVAALSGSPVRARPFVTSVGGSTSCAIRSPNTK